MMASVVDLGSDASPLGRPPDELVAEDASKAHVTPGELQISVADPDSGDGQPNFAWAGGRLGQVAA